MIRTIQLIAWLLAVQTLPSLANDSTFTLELTDIEGKEHTPFNDSSTTAVVLVFISKDCPIANSYQPLLRRLTEEHVGNGVRVFQIHPQSTVTRSEARQHASDYDIQSPVIIDSDQKLTKLVKARVTPEVFVFLKGDALPIYRGRIDNLYAGYGKKRRVVTETELADVLDSLAAGQQLERSTTESVGCLIQFETNHKDHKDNATTTGDRIGYEILQVKSHNEIIAWASKDITREEFEALELPAGWIKNQPREIEMDRAKFLNSPDLTKGRFRTEKHFGHQWLHVATVKKIATRVDATGYLSGCKVMKDHVIGFDPGTTLVVLVSPEGEAFPRITRDANRTRDTPSIPPGWKLIEYQTSRPLEFRLSNGTTVIRARNQDSFQGPVALESNELTP